MTETTDPPQLLDRVTPDAVLLLPPGADYDAPEVREIRRGGIHGSDVAAIVGVSKYDDAGSIYYAKRDGLYADRSEALDEFAFWGHEHEPTIARVWAARNGLDVDRDLVDVGTLVNVDHPWMRAQVDRLLLSCPDMPIAAELVGAVEPVCSLEVKNRSGHVASRWAEDVPDDVLAQVAWQRMVTGLDHVHIACHLDGNRLVQYRYDFDPDLEGLLATECGALWDRVAAGDPPDLVYSEAMRSLLDRLYPDRSGARDLTPTEYGQLLGPWEMWRQAKQAAADLGAVARGRVLEALGSAEVLTFDRRAVFTYRQVEATDVAAYTRKAYRALNGPR